MKRSSSAWAGLSTAILLVAVHPALAEPTRDAVMDAAQRCEGIPDNRVWLDCFYGSAQPMRSVLGLAPAPESQTRLVPGPGTAYGGAAPVRRAPPPVRQKQETFLSAVLGSTKPLADNMPMTAYGFSRNGKFTVTMADGHVWQQAESDIKIAKWDRPAATYKVDITNGTSTDLYNMRVRGELFKVTRVK
jgi:prepilin-type processing-associated H-X9-DG protein